MRKNMCVNKEANALELIKMGTIAADTFIIECQSVTPRDLFSLSVKRVITLIDHACVYLQTQGNDFTVRLHKKSSTQYC